eukprot:GHRQ01026152.1.p1 GENE.GHRQ01026152.1~~GHRQ01026152.1.p1  ORF type:complete len:184 (-),score=64.25 GHRQ01026152.1:318-869(-)
MTVKFTLCCTHAKAPNWWLMRLLCGVLAAAQACLAKRGFLLAPQAEPADTSNLPDQQQMGSAAATGNSKHSSGSSSAGGVELFYDAVVVGSGAGGGVTAALLAAAGVRVLVLEKAGWVRRKGGHGRILSSSYGMWLCIHLHMFEGAVWGASEWGSIVSEGTNSSWHTARSTKQFVVLVCGEQV